uniref:Uncharacterized protein n=1 Tax=Moorena producens (strain JHB) TaxID=1454205 RepID=A0A1D9G7U2_MOOP1
MIQYDPLQYLPSAEELPDSDDTPVDNELQILIPTLLRAVLSWLWSERQDWFLGVNMEVYFDTLPLHLLPVCPTVPFFFSNRDFPGFTRQLLIDDWVFKEDFPCPLGIIVLRSISGGFLFRLSLGFSTCT